MWRLGVLLSLGVIVLAREVPRKAAKAACDSCHETMEGVINVHLVPHSHDDVGWLKTVDQYFYGAKNVIQTAGVQYILDSVVQDLMNDEDKRFIQVETGFFWRWWNEQDDSKKAEVVQLVAEGRLELAGGGWSMNDEAAAHYSSIIDNMALGFKVLKDTFGDCGVPKIAWQIDPFGHSREQASLFAQMGLDGLFFARIDYRDKIQRRENQTLQMLWEGTDHLGEPTSIFTGAFAEHYGAPSGFCFDILCNTEDPIEDDENLQEFNLDQKLDEFVAHVEEAVGHFVNNEHIMFTMGGDFTYQLADMYYKNLDKLIRHMNERTAETGINVLYSTPYCYLKAVNEEMQNHNWVTKTDDFFPYADGEDNYWTGYFTSRPSFKFHERQSHGVLQAAKQVQALLSAEAKINDNNHGVFALQEALAIAQHHDAITGTAKQHVDDDYNVRLARGQKEAHTVTAQTLADQLNLDIPDLDTFSCPQLNASICGLTENNDNLVLMVYNSLSRERSVFVRLPVKSSKTVSVFDEEGAAIPVETISIRNQVLNYPGRGDDVEADVEAVFMVEGVPALGYKTLYIQQEDEPTSLLTATTITSQEFLDELPGGLQIGVAYYNGYQGDGQKSGAYIFRPDENTPQELQIASQVEKIEGTELVEYRVTLDLDWASFVVRHYPSQDEWEVEWMVGPIPVGDGQGKEVIMTYSAANVLDSNGRFYTDANGRQMMPRVRDQRFSYDLGDDDQIVTSNYYPVTAAIFTESEADPNERLIIVNDRSQGGSSINDGQIEIMVHRRLLYDDFRGVGEALNERAFGTGLIVNGKHSVKVSSDGELSAQWLRQKMQQSFLQPTLLFIPTSAPLDEWLAEEAAAKTYSALAQDLPENIIILTLEKWNDQGDVLIRLEHTYDEGEHPELSAPVTVDLTQLFSDFQFVSAVEMTLGGNMELSAQERLHWNSAAYRDHPRTHSMAREFDGANVELQPMEIRTFVLSTSGDGGSTTSATTDGTNGTTDSMATALNASSVMATISTMALLIMTKSVLQ